MNLLDVLLTSGISAALNMVTIGAWGLFVERRIRRRDDAFAGLVRELKDLRDQRIVSIEARLTGQHKSKDQLEATIREELKSKVDDATLRRELIHTREALETTNERLGKAEEKLDRSADTIASTAAVVDLIAGHMNISLPGRKSSIPAD